MHYVSLRSGRVLVIALLSAMVAATFATGQDSTLAERILPADSIAAVFLRDGNATLERWKTTALHKLLQTPEMMEMTAPLKESIAKLTAYAGPLPTSFDALTPLLKGEVGLAVVVGTTPAGPFPAIQLLLRPADREQAKAVVRSWLDAAVENGLAQRLTEEGATTVLKFDRDMMLSCSFAGDVMLLTAYPQTPVGGSEVHKRTLARRMGMAGEGGIVTNPEYVAVRRKLGAAPDAWAYLGVFDWLAKNPDLALPVSPFLATLGLNHVRGCAAGCTIEDRGFRTRVFVKMPPSGAERRTITAQDLAVVPQDVLAFRMGPMNLQGLYDVALMIMGMIPGGPGQQVMQAIMQAETSLGMSIRNDILGVFGDRYVGFANDPSSRAESPYNLYLSVKDKGEAVEKLTRLLNVIADLIKDEIGEEGDAFVRIKSIERNGFTHIYPQSVLPAAFSPNLVVADNWAGLGFSARFALAGMDHFLHHQGSVSDRRDFADVLAKMPKGYYAVSYTDVRACFANGLTVLQFLTDLAVTIPKIAATQGELELPMAANELWGMDQGRFPTKETIGDNLFGAVSVRVRQQDGVLYENFSPVGPLPLQARVGQSPLGNQQIATTAILAGMLLPALARAREEGRKAVCANNLAQIVRAIITYQEPNDDNLPPSLADLVPAYVPDARLLVCPSDGAPFMIKGGMPCSYRYIGNIPFRDVGPDQMIAYDHQSHAGRGRNVAHFDGHVRWYNEWEFQEKLQEQYDAFEALLAKPDFRGDEERVRAFFEDRDFAEK